MSFVIKIQMVVVLHRLPIDWTFGQPHLKKKHETCSGTKFEMSQDLNE